MSTIQESQNPTENHLIASDEEQVVKFLNHEQNKLEGKVTNWNKVNLRNVGYKLAGLSAASTDALVLALNRVREAIILETAQNAEDRQVQVDQEVGILDDKIAALKIERSTIESDIQSFEESKIPLQQSTVLSLNDALEDLQIEITQEQEIEHSSTVSKWMYVGISILGLAWIYAFYLSASYSAFFRGLEVTTVDDISALLGSVFTAEAFQTLNFHWVVPFMFILLGAMLHMALESVSRARTFKIVGASLVVIFADAILAYCIEGKSHQLKFITGQIDDNHFGLLTAISSPTFYMVLIMGSLSVIAWSLVVFKVANLFNTNKITRSLLIKQRNIKKKITEANNRLNLIIAECNEIKTKIPVIDARIDEVIESRYKILSEGLPIEYSTVAVKNNLLAFYTGWMTNIAAYNNRKLEDRTRSSVIETLDGMDIFIPGINNKTQLVQLNQAS